jgi:hypothetical protein
VERSAARRRALFDRDRHHVAGIAGVVLVAGRIGDSSTQDPAIDCWATPAFGASRSTIRDYRPMLPRS